MHGGASALRHGSTYGGRVLVYLGSCDNSAVIPRPNLKRYVRKSRRRSRSGRVAHRSENPQTAAPGIGGECIFFTASRLKGISIAIGSYGSVDLARKLSERQSKPVCVKAVSMSSLRRRAVSFLLSYRIGPRSTKDIYCLEGMLQT